jgi:hypothetical protein
MLRAGSWAAKNASIFGRFKGIPQLKNPPSVSSTGFPSQSDIAPTQTVQGGALKDCSSARADDVTVLVCCPLLLLSEAILFALRGFLLGNFLLCGLLLRSFLLSSHVKSPIWIG